MMWLSSRLGQARHHSLHFQLLLLLTTFVPTTIMADTNLAEFSRRLGIFSINMFSELSALKPNQNLVFSPFSIHTCVAMARIGAEGKTAEELDRGLGLASSDVNEIAENYYTILASYENSDLLKIANKIYVMKNYAIQDEFNNILSRKFFTTAEAIDFAQSTTAAKTINDWVESKTNYLIKDLISPASISEDTRLVLLNAIHFKGKWKYQFPPSATKDDNFHLNDNDIVKVPMMNVKERFNYAALPELDATALEMPYKDSDLSMLIILPNSITGLKHLEEKLKSIQLSEITNRLYKTQVIVRLPKFKVEFSIKLTNPLKQLGMKRMFSSKAEFGKMIKTNEELQVSEVIHKAFIEVNEEGTEAAAATGSVVRMKRSLDMSVPIDFCADHPFFYIINHKISTTENVEQTSSKILFLGIIQNVNGHINSPRDEL